jgi:ribosomal protein S18 acetylase RimI-like enzyme
MTTAGDIEIRPARRPDCARLADFLSRTPAAPGAAVGTAPFLDPSPRNQIVAVQSGEIVGACVFIPGSGRCAALLPPRLIEWDEGLAARLLRAAAARVYQRDGARLIQALTEPHGESALAGALARAGLEPLAMLAYLRRSVLPLERDLPLPPDIEWRHYGYLKRRQFAETIAETYQDSLDCPRLAGLRTVDDAITTHKHTGFFTASAWNLAMKNRLPAGVVLVNNLQGRGEVVYLGTVGSARRQGIGRALITRAIRDTALMGLPTIGLAVDVANTPALRLYEAAGFREIRRRMAYFIPATRLDTLV